MRILTFAVGVRTVCSRMNKNDTQAALGRSPVKTSDTRSATVHQQETTATAETAHDAPVVPLFKYRNFGSRWPVPRAGEILVCRHELDAIRTRRSMGAR